MSSTSFRSNSVSFPSFSSSPSSSSSFSVFRKSSLSSNSFSAPGDTSNDDMNSGHPFLEMMQAHETYRLIIRSPAHYEIKLFHGTMITNCHWYLLVKMKDSELPYITIEITTTTMTNLIQTIRIVKPDGGVWSNLLLKNPLMDIGTYKGTLHDICCLADEVVSDMQTYDLGSNNCQDFCNKLLIKMRMIDTALPTTLHMEEGSMFDCFSVVLRKVYGVAVSNASGVVATAGATVLAGLVGAPIQNQRLNNLKPIYKILSPLAAKWREIGTKLPTSDEVLNRIETENGGVQQQCLREMLREHLLQVDSYETLAGVVEEYNQPLSVKIRHVTPYGQAPQLTIN